jgi:hypothetical protein
MFPVFRYQFDAGPVAVDRLYERPTVGNCRYAVQWYFFHAHQIALPPEDCLNPRLYRSIGTFTDVGDAKNLQIGDIVFAEKTRGRNGELVDRGRDYFASEDEWIIALHTAIAIGDDRLWHATALADGSCIWDFATFTRSYKIVAARRVLTPLVGR